MLRAEQWLMIGVGAIGAYAVYRLVTERKQNGNVLGPPERVPSTGLPERAGPVTTPPDAVAYTGATVPLQNQRWYGGRIETIPSVGLFTADMPRSGLVGTLTQLGFGGSAVRPDAPEAAGLPLSVQVFLTPEEARAAGLPDYAIANAGRGSRWFYGRWTRPDEELRRPSYLPVVWLARSPG